MGSAGPGSGTPGPRGSNVKSAQPRSQNTSSFDTLQHHNDSQRHAELEPLLAGEHLQRDVESDSGGHSQQTPVDNVRAFFAFIGEKFQACFTFCGRHLKLILSALALVLVVIVFVLSIGLLNRRNARTGKEDTCTSAACVHAASEILYNLSPNYAEIDPCEHFDVFACQGFEEHHVLRPDQGDMFRGTLMAEDAEITLRQILESDDAEVASADRKNFDKLKADYLACMDEETIEAQGLDPLLRLTDKVTSIYSLSEDVHTFRDFDNSQALRAGHANLTDIFVYLLKFGVSPFISIGVGADDKDPETQIVFASPPWTIGLPSKEYYEDNKTLKSYEEVIEIVLPHFMNDSDKQSARTDGDGTTRLMVDLAASVVEFEQRLARASPPQEDLNDITKSYNKMKLSETKKALPQLSLDHVIRELAPKDYAPEQIIVASPSYLEAVAHILDKTPKSVVQAYLVWKTVQSYSSRIEDDALKPLERFNNQLQGKEPDAKPERWRRCISAADNDLGWILSKFFVDKAFSPESKRFGDRIISDIKNSFVSFLKEASWMTDDNRERAMTKVHAIDQKIGYPTSNPDIMDPKALKKYYKAVEISNDTFFENALHVAEFEIHEQWSKLGKPTRHDEWGMTVPTVNAYYNPAGNEIVFPAGIMQRPVFYDPTVPQYLSYGAFGAVSGHELSHAFDNTGSQYDETGKYNDWWSNETRKAFNEKTTCFVDQYSKYSVTGPDDKEIHVNGQLTLGENVADAGGIHAAFSAWKKREEENPSKLLPGLHDFTKEQLFFVNYANWWCGKSTKETAVRRIYVDPHAPKWARILGTMANSADFRKAFNCPSKRPTCELW